MPAPTNEELKADLAGLAATADEMLAKDPAGEAGRVEGAPDGFSMLPKEWQDYITQLEGLVDDQDESFAAGMEGRPTKAQAEAADLKEKLAKAENELGVLSEREQKRALADITAMLGEDFMKHVEAEAYAEKLYKLMEGGMEFAEAKSMIRKKMGLDTSKPAGPRGADGIPSGQPGGSDFAEQYMQRVRGNVRG